MSNAAALRGGEPGVFQELELFQAWDRDYYHPAARPFYDRAIRRMLRRLACPPGSVILDAGCGPGEHAIRAAREGFRVAAIDLSETVLEEARRRAKAAKLEDRITFLQGDLTNLHCEDNSVAAIFCWGVLIHIPQIEQALGELVRVLQPGGRLALYVTNAAAWDHVALRVMRRVLGKQPSRSERLAMGRGTWHQTGADRLWVWHIDVAALTQHVERHGMHRVARIAGEFTETQRRLRGPLRRFLLWVNRAYSFLYLPARPCADNLLIFEKAK